MLGIKLDKRRVLLLILFITAQMVGTLYIPRLTADIINHGVMLGDRDYVLRTGFKMLGIAVATGAASILATRLNAHLATGFAKSLRRKLFAHTQNLSVQDFKIFKTSSLITRCTNDIEQIQGMISMFFSMLLPVPFVAVVGFVLTYTRDPYMALLIFVTTLVFFLVIFFVSKTIIVLSQRIQVALDEINGKVGQYISGIRVIRAFDRSAFERKRMNQTFSDYAKLNLRINRTFAKAWPLIMIVMNLSTISILWFGAQRIDSGAIQIGDIMAVIEYATITLFQLLGALMALLNLPRAMACFKRVKEVLDHEPEIVDGEVSLKALPTRLEFKDVSFGYENSESPVLRNLNFVCESGKTTAIIGGTGSGKSTLAKLIPRLYEVQKGEILLNGINIKKLKQKELRDKVGFVPQKAFLFSGSIEDNMRHGKKDATFVDIKQATKIAQAEDFIKSLEEGYQARVAQKGSNFSGGQKQRLAMARALVKNPSIYVFDDSFSALDYKTDAALREALKAETTDSIVVIVAQRISSIMDADQIIVLDEGAVVGRGTHQELLNNCEIYKQIAESQMSAG